MSTTDTVLRLGARPWSHLIPLTLSEVSTPGLNIRVDRRARTPDLLEEPALDAAETSFSRYVRARAAGDDRIIGVPAFVMRGFRHRCILVRRDSRYRSMTDLAATRIGLTGWPDSGNVWTRSLLRQAGVGLDAISWTVGPLSAEADGPDRLGGLAAPRNVRLAEPGSGLVDALLAGELDALMTPFMPPGFHQADSPLRPLLADYPAAELHYLRTVGFIPGIHLVGVRRELVDRRPEVLTELMAALRRSKDNWWADHRKLADPTPWALADVDRTERLLGADWMPYGLAANAGMIAAFCAELAAQSVLAEPVDPAGLFAEYANIAQED